MIGLCIEKSLSLGRGTAEDSRLLLYCIFLGFFHMLGLRSGTAKSIYFKQGKNPLQFEYSILNIKNQNCLTAGIPFL